MAGSRAKKREKARRRAEKELERKALGRQRLLPGWKDVTKENVAFETYYKAQGFVPEGEWDEFMSCLRSSLPANFRITACFGRQAMALRRIIESAQFMNLMVEDIPSGSVEGDTSNGNQVSKPETDGMKTDGANTDGAKTEPDPETSESVSAGDRTVGNVTKVKHALTPLPWYPNRFGWQLNVSRVEIRRSEILQRLHNFLLTESESGYICRQEAVSMIPPLVLDVQPHHRILDMCAAPGSKTSQMIEMIHSHDLDFDPAIHGRNGTADSQCKGTGLIVANDIDNKRCYMLVHQAKKLHSPSCIVTNHDAANMPNFYESISDKVTGRVIRKKLKFDRVLCDAPCSGDGTMRKNIDVWAKWNVANGNNFHGLQSRIVKRGAELTARDGLLVYSTCSLNPQEDEAVVANLLEMSSGGLQLVDVSDRLPGLKTTPGLDSWSVMTRHLNLCNTLDQVEERNQTQIRAAMFPPSNVHHFNLRRCIRILPHHQNTGGFFIAVMRKTVDTLPWEAVDVPMDHPSGTAGDGKGTSCGGRSDGPTQAGSGETEVKSGETEVGSGETEVGSERTEVGKGTEEKSSVDAQTTRSPPRKKLKRFPGLGHREDPFIFFTESEPEWPDIKKFYNITDAFPFEQLMYRCVGGKKRNIYFLTPSAKKLIQDNENNIKFINAGARLFNLNVDNECHFRLCQEGLQSVFPFIRPESIIETTFEDMKKLLLQDNVPFADLSPEVRTKVEPLGTGSCILVHRYRMRDRHPGSSNPGSSNPGSSNPDSSNPGSSNPGSSNPASGSDAVSSDPIQEQDDSLDTITVPICGWKGKFTLRPYIAKNERIHFLRLIGVETKESEDEWKAKFEAKQERKNQRRNGQQLQGANDEVKEQDSVGGDEEEDLVHGEDSIGRDKEGEDSMGGDKEGEDSIGRDKEGEDSISGDKEG